MSSDAIRVLLADDHAVVRAGLRSTLVPARDITVVGEASNGLEAVSLAEQLAPDVVVMDLSMPVLDGIAATREILVKVPHSRVLVLTMYAEEEYVQPVLEAGAAGYLMKANAHRELVDAIRAVAHGDRFVRVGGPGAARNDSLAADRDRFERLTGRERDVLSLVGQGYSAPEIGRRLSISPKTVDTYKQRIQEKLGLAHRSQYVQFALKLGLLSAG